MSVVKIRKNANYSVTLYIYEKKWAMNIYEKKWAMNMSVKNKASLS